MLLWITPIVSLCVTFYLSNMFPQNFGPMTVEKKALATIRHEEFPGAQVHFSGNVRWVLLEHVYRKHRRFQETDIWGFYSELKASRRRNGRSLFNFHGIEPNEQGPLESMPAVWVCAPQA